ncbi:hypothetical protein AB1L88_08440 [Tautonia sp. JC769]|uniref:hypothetical protein n=1 Tax=Tautonia sp. JC769 TaxID=3232135 RepID=UPI003458D553
MTCRVVFEAPGYLERGEFLILDHTLVRAMEFPSAAWSMLMNVNLRIVIRRIVLLLGILAAVPLAGCGEPQPDLGGAVVVPEPGTSASGEATEGAS